jgi:hypothetical protein
MAKPEPRGRIPQLYRDMRIGQRVIVNYKIDKARRLLRSVHQKKRQKQIAEDGYGFVLKWLYLEPVGKDRTLVVRMQDQAEVEAAVSAYRAKGKK